MSGTGPETVRNGRSARASKATDVAGKRGSERNVRRVLFFHARPFNCHSSWLKTPRPSNCPYPCVSTQSHKGKATPSFYPQPYALCRIACDGSGRQGVELNPACDKRVDRRSKADVGAQEGSSAPVAQHRDGTFPEQSHPLPSGNAGPGLLAGGGWTVNYPDHESC